jgi:hypothetical protein
LIRKPYLAFRLLAAGTALAALSACSTGLFSSKETGPSCPNVSIVNDANRMTVYRPGPGRDLTDIAYEVRFSDFKGGCEYNDKIKEDKTTRYGSVTLNVQPLFLLIPGPAASQVNVDLTYFIEIGEFYPRPEARKEFTRTVTMPANRAQLDVTDSALDLTIPLTEKRLGPDVHIYLGFVLTPDQLEENRRVPAGRLRS